MATKEGEPDLVEAVVEATREGRVKYKLDPSTGVLKFHKILPEGSTFPFNFGCVPGTLAEDGDPLDILILTDVPAFPGCHLPCRLVGVLEAKQKDSAVDSTVRNDRLIAVAAVDKNYEKLKSCLELPKVLLEELSHFFVSYNEIQGKTFLPIGYRSSRKARLLLRKGRERALSERSRSLFQQAGGA